MPASMADMPAVSCRNSATSRVPSDTAAYRKTVARLPTAKLRAAKMCSGIIGFGALRSHHGNAIRQATPTSRLVSTAGWDKPNRCCSMRAYTAPVSPTALSTAPTTSTLARRSDRNSSCESLVVRYSVMANGAMLTPKIHRQPSVSTRTPPSSGPMTKAVPVQAVQVPIALPCRAPENRELIIASELGTRKAAPTPCRQRAATNTQPLGAKAHNSDETAKMTRPILSTTNRPKASEIAPATRISAPRASR